MQSILKFKIETTNEKLTPRTGAIIFGEYLKGMDFEKFCNSEIESSKHHKAYNPFEYIYPLALMLHSGGRVIDDIKEIRMDEALKIILKIDNIPTADAIIKYLHKMGETKNAFKMIVVKKDITPMFKELEEILTDEEKAQYYKELYYCIATNDDDLTPKEIIKLHRGTKETYDQMS